MALENEKAWPHKSHFKYHHVTRNIVGFLLKYHFVKGSYFTLLIFREILRKYKLRHLANNVSINRPVCNDAWRFITKQIEGTFTVRVRHRQLKLDLTLYPNSPLNIVKVTWTEVTASRMSAKNESWTLRSELILIFKCLTTLNDNVFMHIGAYSYTLYIVIIYNKLILPRHWF